MNRQSRARPLSRPVGAGAPDPAPTGHPPPHTIPPPGVRRRSVAGLAMWCEITLLLLAALVITEMVIGAAGDDGARVPVVRHLVKVDPLARPVQAGMK